MSVKTANRNIKSLKPLAQKACNLFMDECKKKKIPIFITETHRSQARQDWLYAQGRTRPGDKVTWTRNSNHTGGMAWDIAVNPPLSLYHDATLNKAGKVALGLGIEWGGTWNAKNLDKPHYEIDNNWKAPTASKPATKVNDGKLRRLYTGVFASEKSAKDFEKKVEKKFNLNWNVRKESTGWRLLTGTFVYKDSALDFKKQVEKEFDITLYIKEE